MQKTLVITLLIFLVQVAISPVFGQAKLEKLVQERERMHDEWKASESKKSGIFGNRTKKDMIETHDWMARIIHKDNQIIKELKLLSEIEKTEITYEKNDYKFIVQRQEREIAILKRALEEKESMLTENSSSTGSSVLVIVILIIGVVVGWRFWKKRSKVSF